MRRFTPGEFRALPECQDSRGIEKVNAGIPFLYGSEALQKQWDLHHYQRVVYCIKEVDGNIYPCEGRIYRESDIKY